MEADGRIGMLRGLFRSTATIHREFHIAKTADDGDELVRCTFCVCYPAGSQILIANPYITRVVRWEERLGNIADKIAEMVGEENAAQDITICLFAGRLDRFFCALRLEGFAVFFYGFSLSQMSGKGSENISSVKSMRHMWEKLYFWFPAVEAGFLGVKHGEEAIIRGDEDVSVCIGHKFGAICPDARINDSDVDCPIWKIKCMFCEHEGSLHDILRRDEM